MTALVRIGLVAVMVLDLGIGARAQGGIGGDLALAMPATGRIAIVNQGKMSGRYVPVGPVSSLNTSQESDVEITVPVVGLPLHGQATVLMHSQATSIAFLREMHITGEAGTVTLHGPAGGVTVSLKVDQPIHGGSYDPAEATLSLRGTGGTGMFDGVGFAGDLKGFFRPTGTVYLGYASSEAALEAARRGLAQDTSISDAHRQTLLESVRQALAGAQLTTFPAAEPSPATSFAGLAAVDVTIQRSGPQFQVALRIVVRAGEPQPVKVLAIGSDGAVRTVYEGVRKPGETVSTSASGPAPLIVQVYVGGVMVRQVTIPAQ